MLGISGLTSTTHCLLEQLYIMTVHFKNLEINLIFDFCIYSLQVVFIIELRMDVLRT